MPFPVAAAYSEIDSCNTIIHFLKEYSGGDKQEIRKVLIRDLCWRLSRLNIRDRSWVLARTCYHILPEDIQKEFEYKIFDLRNGLADIEKGRREEKDIGIITVIGPELKGVLRVLGRNPEEAEHIRGDQIGFWFAEIQGENSRPISIVVTMVGVARNVPCAITVGELLNKFKVKLLILIGVAAGVRGRTQLGDVVYAQKVFDFEGMRLEVRRFLRLPTLLRVERPRPEISNVQPIVIQGLQRCTWGPAQTLFRRLVTEGVEAVPEEARGFEPSIRDGTIAAGEKLFADGSLKKLNKRFDQRIIAGAMEDSGFAQTADRYKIPWCIFRGICDYGDSHKGPKWQHAAAIAAASAAITFVNTAGMNIIRGPSSQEQPPPEDV